MIASVPDGVTELLQEWRSGDDSALARLIPLVYRELRQLARQCLRRERDGHTLQTTALVNEAYLRLVRSSRVQWRDRGHFFAMTVCLMRRVLVDEARKRAFQKRGGGAVRVVLADADAVVSGKELDIIAVDRALEQLARFAPRKARVVELRFFGGLSIEETAQALDVSIDSVKREWRTAKLWLLGALSEAVDGTGALESH